jgi:AraC-like DNA-binding protein
MSRALPSSRSCIDCGSPRAKHFNAKYCLGCRALRRRRPAHRLTKAQAAEVERLRGTLFRWQIAEHVGVSGAAVARYLREAGLDSNARDYPQATVAAVCAVYETLGIRRTQELFPDVVVRSIVERHKEYAPRQVRWRDPQIIEAARMAGLVSANAQARYFGRPNAYSGSIGSLWDKHFGCAPRDINGLSAHLVWRLTRPGVPAVLVKHSSAAGYFAKVLWLDLAGDLKPTVAPVLRTAILALARFQAWLHGTSDTLAIQRMIHEREERYGAPQE